MNLYVRFASQFLQYPDKIALTTLDGCQYTYLQLHHNVAQHANALQGFGLKQGDKIAVIAPKSLEVIWIYLACLASGIIYLPLNPDYTQDEIAYYLNDFSPDLIFVHPPYQAEVNNIKQQNKGLGQIHDLFVLNSQQQSKEFQAVNCATNTVAVVLYTSGTTGKPKGVMITHDNLSTNASTLRTTWEMSSQDILLHALPLFHVHGLFFALHTILISAASLVFLPKFDVDRVIEYLPRVTLFMGVPTYYNRLLHDERLTDALCAKIRLFISGSAPLLESTFDEFKHKTGHEILERYGMTESGINASNPVHGIRKVGTVGLPLPGVTIRIINNAGKEVELGEIGGIQIKGPNIFNGYWQLPEKTAEDFTADGYFRTGDLGKFDEDGYLIIVGRSKDMIITGGLNVYPKEIELTLDIFPGIKESAVIGLPHPDFGEAVVAVIVKNQGNYVLDETEIIAYLKLKHAAYKLPKKIFFIEELPKNTLGKVQKNELRKRFTW